MLTPRDFADFLRKVDKQKQFSNDKFKAAYKLGGSIFYGNAKLHVSETRDFLSNFLIKIVFTLENSIKSL